MVVSSVFENINREYQSSRSLIPHKKITGKSILECHENCSSTGTEYKTSRRPLIDSVRSNLQALLERAAEADREKTIHRELTREGSMARSRMLFDMTRGGNDDEETKSSDSSKRQSSEANRSTTGSSLQGNNSTSSSVQIEMGSLTSSSPSSSNGGVLDKIVESKEEVGEAPLEL